MQDPFALPKPRLGVAAAAPNEPLADQLTEQPTEQPMETPKPPRRGPNPTLERGRVLAERQAKQRADYDAKVYKQLENPNLTAEQKQRLGSQVHGPDLGATREEQAASVQAGYEAYPPARPSYDAQFKLLKSAQQVALRKREQQLAMLSTYNRFSMPNRLREGIEWYNGRPIVRMVGETREDAIERDQEADRAARNAALKSTAWNTLDMATLFSARAALGNLRWMGQAAGFTEFEPLRDLDSLDMEARQGSPNSFADIATTGVVGLAERNAKAFEDVHELITGEQNRVASSYLGALREEQFFSVVDGLTSPSGLVTLVGAIKSPVVQAFNRALDRNVMSRVGQLGRKYPVLTTRLTGGKETFSTVQEEMVEQLGVDTAASVPRALARKLQYELERVGGVVYRNPSGQTVLRVGRSVGDKEMEAIRRAAGDLQAATQGAGKRLQIALDVADKAVSNTARLGVNVLGNVATQPFSAVPYAAGGDPERAIYEMGPGSLNAATIPLYFHGLTVNERMPFSRKPVSPLLRAKGTELIAPGIEAFVKAMPEPRILGAGKVERVNMPNGGDAMEAVTTVLPKFDTQTVDVDASRRILQDKIRATGDPRPVEVITNLAKGHDAFLAAARQQPEPLAREAIATRENDLASRLALMADLVGAEPKSPDAAAIIEKVFDPDTSMLDPLEAAGVAERARGMIVAGEIKPQTFAKAPSMDSVDLSMVNHPNPLLASMARWQATNGLATYVGRLVSASSDPRHALEPTSVDVVANRGRLWGMHPDLGWRDISEDLTQLDLPADMRWEWEADKNSPLAVELRGDPVEGEYLVSDPVETRGRQPARDLLNYRAGITSGSAEDNLASLAYDMSSKDLTPEGREEGKARLKVLEEQHAGEWTDIRETLDRLRGSTIPVERVQLMGGLMRTHMAKRQMLDMVREFIDKPEATREQVNILPMGAFDARVLDANKEVVGRISIDPRHGALSVWTTPTHYVATVGQLAKTQMERAGVPIAVETDTKHTQMLERANSEGLIRHSTMTVDGKTYSVVAPGHGDVADPAMPLRSANEDAPPPAPDNLTQVRSTVRGLEEEKAKFDLSGGDRRQGERRKQYTLEPDWVARRSRELVEETQSLLNGEFASILRDERGRAADYASRLADSEAKVRELETKLAAGEFDDLRVDLPPGAPEVGSKQVLAEMARSLRESLLDSGYAGPELRPNDLTAIANFMNEVGPEMFDFFTLKMEKGRGPMVGNYQIEDGLRGIARVFGSAINNTMLSPTTNMSPSAAAMAHEMWHHLSRFLPEADRLEIQSQFLRERADFFAKNPHMDQLVDRFDPLVGLPTLSREDMTNMLARFPEMAEAHFAKVEGHPEEDRFAYMPSPEEYPFLSLDEYFAEGMLSRMIGDKKSATYDKTAGIMGRVKEFFGRVGDAFMRMVGRIVGNPDTMQRVYRNFIDGKYSNRQPLHLLGAADRAFLYRTPETIFSRLLKAATGLPTNFAQKAQWIKGQMQGKGMLMGNALKWQEAKDIGLAEALEKDPERLWTKDDLVQFLEPRVLTATIYSTEASPFFMKYSELKALYKDAVTSRRSMFKSAYENLKYWHTRLAQHTAKAQLLKDELTDYDARRKELEANAQAAIHESFAPIRPETGPLFQKTPKRIPLTVVQGERGIPYEISQAGRHLNELEIDNPSDAERLYMSLLPLGLRVSEHITVSLKPRTGAQKARHNSIFSAMKPLLDLAEETGLRSSPVEGISQLTKLLSDLYSVTTEKSNVAAVLRNIGQQDARNRVHNYIRDSRWSAESIQKMDAYLRREWAKRGVDLPELEDSDYRSYPWIEVTEPDGRVYYKSVYLPIVEAVDRMVRAVSSQIVDSLKAEEDSRKRVSLFLLRVEPDLAERLYDAKIFAPYEDALNQAGGEATLDARTKAMFGDALEKEAIKLYPDSESKFVAVKVENGQIALVPELTKYIPYLTKSDHFRDKLTSEIADVDSAIEDAAKQTSHYKKKVAETSSKRAAFKKSVEGHRRSWNERNARIPYGPTEQRNYWLGGASAENPVVLAYGVEVGQVLRSIGFEDPSKVRHTVAPATQHYNIPNEDGVQRAPLFHILAQTWKGFHGMNEGQSDWQQQGPGKGDPRLLTPTNTAPLRAEVIAAAKVLAESENFKLARSAMNSHMLLKDETDVALDKLGGRKYRSTPISEARSLLANMRDTARQVQLVLDRYSDPEDLVDRPWRIPDNGIKGILQMLKLEQNQMEDVLSKSLDEAIEELETNQRAGIPNPGAAIELVTSFSERVRAEIDTAISAAEILAEKADEIEVHKKAFNQVAGEREKVPMPPILEDARRLMVDSTFRQSARVPNSKGVLLNSGIEVLRRTAGLTTSTMKWTWNPNHTVTVEVTRTSQNSGADTNIHTINLTDIIQLAGQGELRKGLPLTAGEVQSLAYHLSQHVNPESKMPDNLPISGTVDGLTKRWPLEIYGAAREDILRVFPNQVDLLKYAWDNPDGKTSSRFGSLFLKKAKALGMGEVTLIEGDPNRPVGPEPQPIKYLGIKWTPEARAKALGEDIPMYAKNPDSPADDGNRGTADQRVDALTQKEETGGQTIPSDLPDWVRDMHNDYEEGVSPNIETGVAEQYRRNFVSQLADPTRTLLLPEGHSLTVASTGRYVSTMLAQKMLQTPWIRTLGETLASLGTNMSGEPLRVVLDPTPAGEALGFYWKESNGSILYLNLDTMLNGRYLDSRVQDIKAFEAVGPLLKSLGFDVEGASPERVNAFRGSLSLIAHEFAHIVGATGHGRAFLSSMMGVMLDLTTTPQGIDTLRRLWMISGMVELEGRRLGENVYTEGAKKVLAQYNHPNDVVELPYDLAPDSNGKHARRGAGDDRVRLDGWIRKQRNTGQADPSPRPGGGSLDAGGLNRLGEEGYPAGQGGEGRGPVELARSPRKPDELRRDARAKLGRAGVSPAEYGSLSLDGQAVDEQLQHFTSRLAAVLRDSRDYGVTSKRLSYMEPGFDAAGHMTKGPKFATQATKIIYSPDQQKFLKERWEDLRDGVADFWDAHSALDQTLAAKRIGQRRLLLSPEQTLNLVGGRDLLSFDPEQIPEILKGLQSQEAVEQLTVNLIKSLHAFDRVVTDDEARAVLREGQLALNDHINEEQGKVQESFIQGMQPLVGKADTPLNRFIVRTGTALDHALSALRGLRIMALSPSAGIGDGKWQTTIGTAATYAQGSKPLTDIHSMLSKAFHGFRTEMNNVISKTKPVLDLLENDPALDATLQKALGYGYDAEMLTSVGENRTFQLNPDLRKALNLPESRTTITTAELANWFKTSFFPGYIERVKEVELADKAQTAAINALVMKEVFTQLQDAAAKFPELKLLRALKTPEQLAFLLEAKPEALGKIPADLKNAIKSFEFAAKLRKDANERRRRILEEKAMERENYSPFLYLHRMMEDELSRDLDDIYSGDRRLSDEVRARFALHREKGDFPFPSLAYGLKLYIPTMLKKIHVQPALRKVLPVRDQLPPGSAEKRYVDEMVNIARGQITWFDSFINNLVASVGRSISGRPEPGKALAEARTGVDVKSREQQNPLAFSGRINPIRKISNYFGSLSFMGMVHSTSLGMVNALENLLASARFAGDGPLLRTKARGWDGKIHKVGGLPALFRLAKSFATAPISHGADLFRQWGEHRGQSIQYSPARASGAIDMYNRLHADYLRSLGNVDLRKRLDRQDPNTSTAMNAVWMAQFWMTWLIDNWSRYGYFNAAYGEFRRMGASEEQAAFEAGRLTKREYSSNYPEDQSPYFQSMAGRWMTFLKKFALNRGLSEMLINDLGAALQAREMGARDSFVEGTTKKWSQRFKETFELKRQTPEDELATGRQIFMREAARRAGTGLSMFHFGNTRAGGLTGAGMSVATLLGGLAMGGPAGGALAAVPAALAYMLGTPSSALKKTPGLRRPGEEALQPPGRRGQLGNALEVSLRHGGLDPSVLDDPSFFMNADIGRFSQAEQEAYKEMVVQLAGMVGADQQLPNTAIEAGRRKTAMNVFNMALLAMLMKKMGVGVLQAFPFLLNLSMVLYERLKEINEYGIYLAADTFTDTSDWGDHQRQRYNYLGKNMMLNLLPFGSSLRQWRNDQLLMAKQMGWKNDAQIREQGAFQLMKSLLAAKGPVGAAGYMMAPTLPQQTKEKK